MRLKPGYLGKSARKRSKHPPKGLKEGFTSKKSVKENVTNFAVEPVKNEYLGTDYFTDETLSIVDQKGEQEYTLPLVIETVCPLSYFRSNT